MSQLFLMVLNMSFAASWLIPVVLLLRLVLKKAPRWVHVLLWAMVGLRLLCPFSVESALSLLPSAEVVAPEIIYHTQPQIHTGIAPLDQAVNPGFTQTFAPEVGASVNPLQVWTTIGGLLWLAGFVAMLLYAVISYLRLWHRVRDSQQTQKRVYASVRVDSPFVLGLFRPRIYLPEGLPEADQALVLAHENAHLRRKDHWWKPLGFFLLSVHWFNPLMWLAYILLCRDIELACDEKVIALLPPSRRADYSQALLNCSVRRSAIVACPLAFGEVGVRARIKSILSYKKPGFWILLIAIVACIAVAVCFLTNPDTTSSERILAVGVQEYDGSVLKENAQWFYYKIRKGEPILLPGASRVEISVRSIQEDAVTVRFYTTMHQKYGPPLDQLELESGQWVDLYTGTPGGSAKYSFLLVSQQEMEPGFAYSWLPDAIGVEAEQVTMFPYCPGVMFHYWGGEVWIDGPELERQVLLSDMLIHNVFFADLSGDGVPEVCATLSFGSGIVDTYVAVADITTGETFTLRERGVYDYTLQVVENQLICTRSDYRSGEELSSGNLTLVQTGGGNARQLLLQQEVPKENLVIRHPGKIMTLKDVKGLAAKGDNWTLADLEGFAYEDVGSGLYVLQYEVEGGYTLRVITKALSDGQVIAAYLCAGNTENNLNLLISSPEGVEAFVHANRQAALENAVSAAILEYNKKIYPDGLIYADSFRVFGKKTLSGTPTVGQSDGVEQLEVYLHAMCTRYRVSGENLGHVDSVLAPAIATFTVDAEGLYTLQDYWQPRTGTNREADIRSRFPEGLVPAAMDCSPYLQELEEACYQKAKQMVFDMGLLVAWLDALFDAIAASPAHSSNPGDYIAAHPEEYRLVLSFGEHTLRYCFERFQQGGQIGLKGHLMALACEEIMTSWGETHAIEPGDRMTGQQWFETFSEKAKALQRLYSDDALEKNHRGCCLLLQMFP